MTGRAPGWTDIEPDGTLVRHCIRLVDLARGHLASLGELVRCDASFVVNPWTAQGHSELDVVRPFEKAPGKPVPYAYKIVARWPRDVAWCFCGSGCG